MADNINIKPLSVNDKPLNDNDKPLSVNDKPLNDNDKPLNDNDKPLNEAVKPSNGNAKPSNDDDDLKPTHPPGYNPGEKKSIADYQKLDAEDESLNRWKASLGIGPGAVGAEPKCTIASLSLVSESRGKPIVIDLTDPTKIEAAAAKPVTIKEGSDYSVQLTFKIEGAIVTGLRYIQVVKRSGLKVDKRESVLGSYGPSADLVVKRFINEEAPSGMLARGTYKVRSRVTDDDNHTHADFDWTFKLAKDWDLED